MDSARSAIHGYPSENSYGIQKRIHAACKWIEDRRLDNKSLRILDYGCGTGELLTQWLGNANDRITGVDFHEQTIEYAKRMNPRPEIAYRTSTLDMLLNDSERFDFVVCSEVLEHIDKPDEFLRRIRDLIVPGGHIIITTPNGYGAYEMLCRVQKAMDRVVPARRRAQPDAASGFLNTDSGHVQFFTLLDLKRLFQKSNLELIERRARTFLCGPYVDPLFNLLPFRQTVYAMNNRIADFLPLSCAADWMFLLRRA